MSAPGGFFQVTLPSDSVGTFVWEAFGFLRRRVLSEQVDYWNHIDKKSLIYDFDLNHNLGFC
jgi:hypothetical protein